MGGPAARGEPRASWTRAKGPARHSRRERSLRRYGEPARCDESRFSTRYWKCAWRQGRRSSGSDAGRRVARSNASAAHPFMSLEAAAADDDGRVTAATRSRSARTSSAVNSAARAANTATRISDSNSASTAALAGPVAAKNTRTDRTRSRDSEYGVNKVKRAFRVGVGGMIRAPGSADTHPMSLHDTPRNPTIHAK